MSWLIQTCTIQTRTQSISTGGQPYTGLDTETAGVACNFQPDTSAEVIIQRQQMGKIGGKLYVSYDTTIDMDDQVTAIVGPSVTYSGPYRVSGPPVVAPGAATKWVPIEREVP